MKSTILVTGASGNLGRSVVQSLASQNFNVRAGARQPDAVAVSANVSPVKFDYTLPETYAPTLTGVQGVFLIAPSMDPEAPAKMIPFIQQAKALGVGHLILNSALGADQNEQSPLRKIERALMDSGIAYTILRPNFFMENFSVGFIAPTIRHQRGIFLAADSAKTSFISTEDIAAVATAAFTQKLTGKEFNLTGAEALDHTQAAKLISDVLGREIAYHALPEAAMLKGARDHGMPEGAVQYLAALYGAVRAGYCAGVTDDVKRVTGRSPIRFQQFAKANQARW